MDEWQNVKRQVESELDNLTGAGSGRAAYDNPEILDFILDEKPLKSKGIHSSL